MGSAYGTVIQTQSHEKLFYKAIKNYILSMNSKITCAEDPEEEFDVSLKGGDHVPTLNFSLNGVHLFKMYRPAALESDGSEIAVNTVNFELDAVAEVPHQILAINFVPSATSQQWTQSTVAPRGIWFTYVANDNFLYIWFGCYNQILRQEEFINGGYVCCLSNNILYLASTGYGVAGSKQGMFNLSGLTFYDGATPGKVGTFLSRFTYAAPPGSIDYIKSSIYMNNNEKQFENRAIYDSTTVTIGDTVSLKDGSYVAIGTHQLVKVS